MTAIERPLSARGKTSLDLPWQKKTRVKKEGGSWDAFSSERDYYHLALSSVQAMMEAE
jgi:hypothetical protein